MLSKSIKAIAKSVTSTLLVFTAVACSSETKQASNPEPATVQPVAPVTTAPVVQPAPTTAAAPPTTPSVVTVFYCVKKESDSGDSKVATFATFARRGEMRSSGPLITWNSTEFGTDYTPEKRCEIVSRKLTDRVATTSNGGRLSGLTLTYGKIIKDPSLAMTVICALDSQETQCNSNNMLFTLSERNAVDPSKTLWEIFNFAKGNATGSGVDEGSKRVENISLDALVASILPEKTTATKPANPAPSEAEPKKCPSCL